MGNVASVGLVKESDFATTKSQFDFIKNEIKYDSRSSQEDVGNAGFNIIKKLSADCSEYKEKEVSRCNSISDSGSVIPSLLSFIGLNGSEDTTVLNAVHAPTKMSIVQPAVDGTDKLADMVESNVPKPQNERVTLQNNDVMPPPARKNGFIAQVEENNLCVFNFMWVCSYGSFTAVPRAYKRLSYNRSVPPPRSPLMKAVKGMQLSMNQTPTQSALTRISALSRRNPANAYRNRHQRRTQLQAPLSAAATVFAKTKAGQNSRDTQIVDAAISGNAQADGKSHIETFDENNNENERENNENSNYSSSSSNSTKVNIRNNGSNNGCGNKGNGKSKAPIAAGAVSATVSNSVRKAPHFSQQPPQKFTLGHPYNRKYNRAPTAMPPQKSTTTKRPKSQSVSQVLVAA